MVCPPGIALMIFLCLVLQGGWRDRVWPSYFAGRGGGGLSGGQLWRGPGPHWGGGSGGGRPELVNGITADGVRTVPLSFKMTVELIQFVGEAQVVNGIGGLRFVVCDLSELLPGRTRVTGWAVLLGFLRVQLFSFSHALLNLYFDSKNLSLSPSWMLLPFATLT